MNNLVPIEQAAGQAPALLRQRREQGLTANKNFQDGVRDAFPVLSIKGKVWSVRISGSTKPFLDPATNSPLAYIDVVLVDASKQLAKSYYANGYSDGDMEAPNCWSLDSVRPDPSVTQKVSVSCISCPMNAFGSKITPSGKAAKACQDARRLVITMPHMLTTADPMLILMRLPQTSLKNLKAYADMLERHGFEPSACITRMQFDYQEAYPKILFNFVAPLNEVEYKKSVELAESANVAAMLQAPDFETALSTKPVQAETLTGHVPQRAPIIPGVTDQPVADHPTVNDPVLDRAREMANSIFPVARQAPVATPPIQAVPQTEDMIELPDGRFFNSTTGQFVERSARMQFNMPEKDPDTMKLPDGQFFNRRLNAFVTGEEKGAQPVTAANAPQRTTRTRKPKEPNATQGAASGQAQAQPQQQAPVEGPATQTNGTPADQVAALDAITDTPTQEPVANGTGDGSGPVVSAASMKLEDVLKALNPG